MANLRANNLTGTGGRNALDGSVFFRGYHDGTNSDYLKTADLDDYDVGTGDFTFECWIKVAQNQGDYAGIFAPMYFFLEKSCSEQFDFFYGFPNKNSFPFFCASIEIAMVDLPKIFDASEINSGFLIAELFIDTLSPPLLSTLLMSLIFLIPPPTVKGMKIFFDNLFISSVKVFCSYRLATTSTR